MRNENFYKQNLIMRYTKTIIWLMSIVLITLAAKPAVAQTAKEIFTSSEIPVTYLGIDFTQAKLIGDAGADAIDIKNRYFSSINQVVINEPKKFELTKAFQKSNISSDLSFVEARNSKVDADKIKSSNTADDSRLNAGSIEKIVKEYNFSGKKGVGLLFIMESMNKTAENGSMYVTFIDMPARKVLFTERLTGKAGGFGFRNYWVKPVHEVLDKIEHSKYKEWKSKYQ
jgi:hypothetical protein